MTDKPLEVWTTGDEPAKVRQPDTYSGLSAALQQLAVADLLKRMPTGVSHAEPVLADAKTADLIMELLSRGFAVLKIPESGTPETLQPE